MRGAVVGERAPCVLAHFFAWHSIFVCLFVRVTSPFSSWPIRPAPEGVEWWGGVGRWGGGGRGRHCSTEGPTLYLWTSKEGGPVRRHRGYFVGVVHHLHCPGSHPVAVDF